MVKSAYKALVFSFETVTLVLCTATKLPSGNCLDRTKYGSDLPRKSYKTCLNLGQQHYLHMGYLNHLSEEHKYLFI